MSVLVSVLLSVLVFVLVSVLLFVLMFVLVSEDLYRLNDGLYGLILCALREDEDRGSLLILDLILDVGLLLFFIVIGRHCSDPDPDPDFNTDSNAIPVPVPAPVPVPDIDPDPDFIEARWLLQ